MTLLSIENVSISFGGVSAVENVSLSVADNQLLEDQIVGSKTVGDDEWLDVKVDLSKFAGKRVRLRIENSPNNWHNEWAYWNNVKIVSD